MPPLLPFGPGLRQAALIGRSKRFFIHCRMDGKEVLAHTNNSGSMLGLLRPGNPVLLSPASGPGRKLAWTLELVGLAQGRAGKGIGANQCCPDGFGPDQAVLWVGVNTLTPNRLLKAAFAAGRLPWAAGYTGFKPEAAHGTSRLDALLTGPDLPPLWVECKNVSLVEDGVAAFPDAVTTRGQKHVREMTALARGNGRAAFFYCVQRNDAACFAPADYVDPDYAALFLQGLAAGVEAHPHLVTVGPGGIDLGPELPLARSLLPCPAARNEV